MFLLNPVFILWPGRAYRKVHPDWSEGKSDRNL